MEKMSNIQNHKPAVDDSTKNSDTSDNFFEKTLITPDLKQPVVISGRTEDCSSDTNLDNVDKEIQYGYKKVCNEKLDNNNSEKLDELFDINKNDSNFTCNSLPVATNYNLNNEIHNNSDDCNSNNSKMICESVNSNNGIIKSALTNSALSSITTYGDTSSDDDCDDDAECSAISQSQEPCNEDVSRSDNLIIVEQLHDACLNSINTNDSQVDESIDFSRTETNHVVSSSSNNESTAFTVSQTVCSVEDDDDSSSSSSVLSNSSSSLVFFENSDFSDDNDANAYDDDDDQNGVNESAIAKKNKKKPKTKSLMTKGELALEDLPPIEDLSISVPQDQCVLLGNILNIVDTLVVVQGLKDLPALDLDTVLFLECNKPLGQVFDVFGPVIEPLYCVRFNSNDHIREKEVAVGMPVYFVPKSNYTNYVFVAQLMKMKGSDASWEDNNEPPSEYLEYSDDEQERRAKKMLRKVAIKKEPKDDPDEPKKKRPPTAFERHMNERNLRMTEMQRRQSQNKKPWKQQNQLIRPPMFMPSTPSCDSNNSTISQSSFDNHVSFDFRSSLRNSPSQSSFNPASDCKPPNFLSSFGYSKPASSFSSPVFPQCPPSPSPQSFSKAFNQNNLLISHASPPSPWITPPVSNSVNISPSSASFISSDGFSSPFHVQHNRMATFRPPVNLPPPPLPQNVYSSTSNTQIVPSSFHPRSSNPVPCPPNIFSSPPPPITQNNPFCSSFSPLSPPPRHHLSATFSSPPPPPHHHPTTFTSPPPPISFNNEINAFPPLHSPDLFCLPNTSSARSNQVDAVAFRPPPPLPGNGSPQLIRQSLQTFQNNLYWPSNPTPPNCRF